MRITFVDDDGFPQYIDYGFLVVELEAEEPPDHACGPDCYACFGRPGEEKGVKMPKKAQ